MAMDRRLLAWTTLAVALTLTSAIASLSIGPYRRVSLHQVAEWISGGSLPPLDEAILQVRLRRTLAGIIIGASLAYAGANLQYLFRNPLADPYVFGIASGAALGVTLALYLGHADPAAVYAYSLAGALASLALVVAGGLMGGGSPFSFIVVGVSLGYLLWSVSLILLSIMGPRSHLGFVWLFGTLAYASGRQLRLAAATLALVWTASILLRSRYSKLLLGPDISSLRGTPYRRAAVELVVLSGVVTAAATAVSGPVGFVGVVAPWFARTTAGSLYGRFIAVSTLWGATLVVLADTVNRLLGGAVELPLTGLLSLIGVPVVVYITLRSRGVKPW